MFLLGVTCALAPGTWRSTHGCFAPCMPWTFGNMAAEVVSVATPHEYCHAFASGAVLAHVLLCGEGADNRHLFTEFLWVRGTRSLPAATRLPVQLRVALSFIAPSHKASVCFVFGEKHTFFHSTTGRVPWSTLPSSHVGER